MNYDKIVDEFLMKNNQHPSLVNIEELTNKMVEDMDKGLAGEESSFMMIPTYLSTEGVVNKNEQVIAIDAGGTNLRIATVVFTDEGVKIDNLKKMRMLGTEKPLTKQEFLDALCEILLPYLQYSHKVGFCFSFAAEITPDMDGKVIRWAKEVNISGCEGMFLGKEINANLKKYGVTETVKFCILNDTVSTLLGGPAIKDGERVDGQIGLILGTGTNTAYVEETSKITKINDGKTNQMIINMESGGFDKMPMGKFDKILDSKSNNPGIALFEKMISGVYLGNCIAETIKAAANEGIFSESNKISELPNFTAENVDQFLREPYGNNMLAKSVCCESDVELLYTFCDRALDRASKLVCINLAADIIKMDGGKKKSSPARLVIEGSTYQYCYSYKERIDYYLRDFLNNKLNRYYTYVSGDEPNLVGSAAAALLNL